MNINSCETLVVSVVCYKNECEIVKFIENVEKQQGLCVSVILVTYNAGSAIEVLEQKKNESHLPIHIYNPAKNLGYLNGCLYGIDQYSRVSTYDWAVICNTDIEFLDNQFFLNFSQKKFNDKIWVVAPCVTLKQYGKKQNPFLAKQISKRKFNFLYQMYHSAIFYRMYSFLSRIKKSNYSGHEQPYYSKIYAAHGSFFFIRKTCIEKLLIEKNDIFMYGEELLIAEIIRENEAIIQYESSLKIIHNENQATGLMDYGRKRMWMLQSFTYLKNRFFNRLTQK